MNHLIPSIGALAAILLPCSAQLVINEVRIDNGGNDSEYFELYNPDASPVDLTGYTYVVIGDGSGGDGVVEVALDLTGSSVPAGGYFVAVNGGTYQLSGVDTDGDTVVDIAVTPDLVASLSFENSDNTTHLLVQGFTGASGDDLDTDNDGTLDVTPWTSIVDAVSVLEEPNPPSSTEFAYATSLGFPEVGPDGSLLPGHVFRNGDGGAWAIGEFGGAGAVDGELTTTGDPLLDSPGIANPTVASGALGISLDTNSISEDGLTVINGTVSIGSVLGADLAVTVAVDDGSEASTFDTTIFAGDLDGVFTITAEDDFWPDGDQTVTVTVDAVNFDSASDTFTVTDDDTDYLLVVNEVYYAVDGSLTDANNDGTTDTTTPSTEEFIELVNTSGATLDLSDVTIYDNFGGSGIHTFPFGTVLEPGCAILVFAGGDIPQGSTASFGETHVQITSGSGLFLDDDGTDFLQILDNSGFLTGVPEGELQYLELPDQTGSPTAGSYALQIDGDGSSGYALHSVIPATSGASYSPGTNLDGTTPFCDLAEQLTVAFNVADVSEAGGVISNGGTVSIPTVASSDVYVYIETSDDTELGSPTTVTPVAILQGDTSADFDLTAVDDLDTDGTVSVTLTARATGYLNGVGSIDVTDNDTVAYTPPNLIITEIMYNPDTSEGGEEPEWIEIYNADSVSVDLGNFLIDDEDSSNWDPLPSATLDPGKYAVVINADFIDAASFRTEWSVPADALVLAVTWGNLSNSPSSSSEILELQDAFANVLDVVNFDDGGDWPSDSSDGPSIALVSGAYDDVSNDDGTNWVRSDDASQGNAVNAAGPTFSTGDRGSPGFDGTSSGPVDFASWATANGIDGEAFGDDFDKDGIPNGVEYAIDGLDPTAPDNLADAFDGSTLSFTKRAVAVANGDVTYAIEESDDLGITDAWEEVLSYDTNDATTIAYTLPGGATRIFARLKIEELAIAF